MKTRSITPKQWDTFIPAKRMAKHLRALARSLEQAGPGVRAKCKISMEVAAEVKKP